MLKCVKSNIGNGSVIDYKVSQTDDISEEDDYRDLVERGLEGVIYEESESQAAHWTNLNVKVAGKTGTGEQTSVGRNICWMVAYAPADDPKYVVAANVDGGDWGSTTAMLVARDVLGQIYGQPDTATTVSDTTD